MKWDLDDLVAPSDIAAECGVGKSTVSNWIARHPDFPRFLAEVSQGHTQLYSRKAVLDWCDRRDWQHDGPRTS